MSIKTYQQEQERMLRHKIGDNLYDALENLVQWISFIRGQDGMETVRPGSTKMELSGLSKNGIWAKDRKENAKSRARNDTFSHTHRSQTPTRSQSKKTITEKKLSKNAAHPDNKDAPH